MKLQPLQPYQPEDLTRVLTFIGECLRASDLCTWHSGDIVHWMSNTQGGKDLEKYYWLYEEDNQLLAFAELPPTKWASYVLIVHPEQRGGALELALLQECQTVMWQRMQAEKLKKTALSMSVRVADQERVQCLTSLGYQVTKPDGVVDKRSLLEPIPAFSVPERFSIRSVAGEQEAALLAEVHSSAFGSSWIPEDYQQVMKTPGFECERELVVVAPDGRFAAFLVYWLDPISKAGLFEPVGCHADFQRKGLTKALMYEGMKRMVAGGMETALVGHDSDNEPANKLYASVGFKLHCEFMMYTKEMTLLA
jgi:mycothiol synthase